jgi:hypothetical protein
LRAWCSVKVDDSGEHIEGEWEYCEDACQPDWCLTDENKCIGTRRTHDIGKIVSNVTHLITFNARTEAPCRFPFKSEDDIVHNACIRNSDHDGLWCATSVDENLKMKNWGLCSASCPKEDANNWPTIFGVTISIFLLLFVIFLSVFCNKAKKNQIKAEEWKKGNLNMINSYMVLNEQASHLSYSGKSEIERSKFDIGRKLGSGNFGSVHEGMAEDPGQNKPESFQPSKASQTFQCFEK